MKKLALLLFGLVLFQAAAFAETITGTVKNVDSQTGIVTITRSDTNQDVKVSVSDTSSLSSMQNGATVSVDATQGLGDTWSASTISSTGVLGTGTSSTDSSGTTGSTVTPEAGTGAGTGNSSASDSTNAGTTTGSVM